MNEEEWLQSILADMKARPHSGSETRPVHRDSEPTSAFPMDSLYTGLSQTERALLAFKLLCDFNEATLFPTVPSLPGSATQDDANVGCQAEIANRWALEHWKMLCRRSAAMGGHHIAADQGNPALAEQFIEAAKLSDRQLLALDLALDQIADEQGWNGTAIRQLVDTVPYQPLFSDTSGVPDIEAMTESFRRILKGTAE